MTGWCGRLSWVLLAVALGSGAGEPTAEQRQRLSESLRAMLVGMAGDPAFRDFGPSQWDFSISADPQRVDNFGVVLDPRFDPAVAEAGPLVLAVTPGSTAARLGLRSGDRLQRINGETLEGLGAAGDGRSEAYLVFSRALAGLQDGEALSVQVRREQRTMVLSGTYREIRIPGFSLRFGTDPGGGIDTAVDSPDGCTTVSVVEAPPREFDIYPAELVAINGEQAGIALRPTHYLIPGAYRFTLREDIPERELADQTRRFSDRRPDQTITLWTEPDMVYQLGARLVVPRREQEPGQPFWRPVLWKAEPGACRGKPVER